MKNVRHNFLNLPNSIEAPNIPKGSEAPSGIIQRIKNGVTDIESYVYPSYDGSLLGKVDALVNWNDVANVQGSGSYLQVEFKHGYVYPTYYSIKGYNADWCFAKEWILYGFNTPEGEMTIIGENKSEGTTFCNSGYAGCNSDNWATFSVKPVKKAFKYFRMMLKGKDSCGNDNLLLSGIEFFGLYSIDGKNKRNTIFYRKCSYLPFCFVLKVIIYNR